MRREYAIIKDGKLVPVIVPVIKLPQSDDGCWTDITRIEPINEIDVQVVGTDKTIKVKITDLKVRKTPV